MTIYLGNNVFARLLVAFDNWYEKYTTKVWVKGNYKATCAICGDTMTSSTSKYSPQECGWDQLKSSGRWICHRCLCHRNYIPYINLVDDDKGVIVNE